MIITKLMGGLGNQMFQYALGRTISDFHGYSLYLDTTGYEQQNGDTMRSYQLESFNIRGRIATNSQLKRFAVGKIGKLINKYSGKEVFKPKVHPTHEKDHDYDSSILELSDNNYLIGYWQSEKYFLRNKHNILKDFTFNNDFSKGYTEKYNVISSSNAVAVHVRRGDYVSSKLTNAYHGVCSPGYYKKAAELLREKYSKLIFFVFSDDINWSRDNILNGHKNVQFVKLNSTNSDLEELLLMSKCKHNIIANSSYSWWAAWLNQYQGKNVIAPKKWFNKPNISTKDLIPKTWQKI